MLKVITGNLLTLAEEKKFDIIMHGCNCFHDKDGGIAAQIWDRYPLARHASIQDHLTGDFNAFGEYSLCSDYKDALIINAYTQYFAGRSFFLPAFISILEEVNRIFRGKSIGIPAIGCGIGGSTLEEVIPAVLKHAPDIEWTLVLWGGES